MSVFASIATGRLIAHAVRDRPTDGAPLHCAYCDTPIRRAQRSWVDETGGDCCWGDGNENQPHTRKRRKR